MIAEGTYKGRADYRTYRLSAISGATSGSYDLQFQREATIVSREGKIRVNATSVMILPPRCRNWRYLCERSALIHVEGAGPF